jgi:NAD(P)-dependent dehydrogenase (short-subunit alcohol dehydrogenase family)
MFDLTGRVALVTGAGRNVGAGIARQLAQQGAKVAVNDLVEARARDTADEIGALARAFAFDVTDPDAVAQGIRDVVESLGPIDILVNNAGVPPQMDVARFRDLDPGLWSKYIDLNLYGVLHCTRHVLDGMIDRRWGRIITISSGAGQTGVGAGISIYGASKAGAIGFSRHLAMEVASKGVTVNCIALGLMTTGTGEGEDLAMQLAATIPMKRVGTPEDVGPAVVYLASQEASWVTGQTLGVNGGSHIP